MTRSTSLCEKLQWDTEFWGFGVARLRSETLTSEQANEATAWARGQGVRCMFFLARSDDAGSVRVAEAHGFHCVDVRMTFERPTTAFVADASQSQGVQVRQVVEADLAPLRLIARKSYGDTRFYFDRAFPRARCDRLYEHWIEQSCAGQADAVLVAELESRVVGYVTCHLDRTSKTGTIGLVGMDTNARGRGIGSRLVEDAVQWFRGQGMSSITVVTQGRNIPAQRLYQRAGFLTRSTALWFHWWGSNGDPS